MDTEPKPTFQLSLLGRFELSGPMVKVGERELEAGNHESALSAANRTMAISGLREDAHRLIMRAKQPAA